MAKKDFIHQIIDFQRAAFENYFSTLVMLQDQTEKLLRPFVDNVPGMGDEKKAFINQWTTQYKKSRDEFKKAIDNGYDRFEAFFDYNAMLQFQEQNEKMFNEFISQAHWLPNDFKKATEELTAIYKNGLGDFKKYVEEKVNHLESTPSSTSKPRRKVKQQK